MRSTKWPNVRVFHRRRGPGPPACEKFRVFDTRVSLRDPRHGFCRRVGAGQRSRYFTRTKNERQTRRLGWGSLLSRSNRCKRTSGAAAAAGGGHFSQHSVKLPPQGQASGEIGPRALGNGGFPGFTNPTREGACVRAVAVEWGIDVLSTAGQQPPARLREVALASSALDNLDAHQIHFGAIDLISDILALKLFRAYGVPDSVAKAFLAHFSSDLAVDLDKARDATQRRTPPAPTRPATLGPQTPMYTSARLLLHCAARPAPARLPAAAWQEVQEAKKGLRE